MSNREQAWKDRAELAEMENARLHAVVEELREKVPQSMSKATMEASFHDLTPAEMLRLASDMFEARQFAAGKVVVDHVARDLALWWSERLKQERFE